MEGVNTGSQDKAYFWIAESFFTFFSENYLTLLITIDNKKAWYLTKLDFLTSFGNSFLFGNP